MFFSPMMLTGTATGVVDSVLSVLTVLGTWFVSTITSMLAIFYSSETGLTVIGVLSVCSLGVSVILLFINKISDFFHWRG